MGASLFSGHIQEQSPSVLSEASTGLPRAPGSPEPDSLSIRLRGEAQQVSLAQRRN